MALSTISTSLSRSTNAANHATVVDRFVGNMELLSTQIATIEGSPVAAWGVCDSSATVVDSVNITSVTDGGVGSLTVTIATDFSDTCYVINSMAEKNSTTGWLMTSVSGAVSVGSFLLLCGTSTSVTTDPVKWHFSCLGT